MFQSLRQLYTSALSPEIREMLSKIAKTMLFLVIIGIAVRICRSFSAPFYSAVGVSIIAGLLAGYETYHWLNNQLKKNKGREDLFTHGILNAMNQRLIQLKEWLFNKERSLASKVGLGLILIITSPLTTPVTILGGLIYAMIFALNFGLMKLQNMARSDSGFIRAIPKVVAGLSGASIAALIVATAVSFVAPGLAVAATPLLLTTVSLLVAFSQQEITSAAKKLGLMRSQAGSIIEQATSPFEKMILVGKIILVLSLAGAGIALAVSPSAPLLLATAMLLKTLLVFRIIFRTSDETTKDFSSASSFGGNQGSAGYVAPTQVRQLNEIWGLTPSQRNGQGQRRVNSSIALSTTDAAPSSAEATRGSARHVAPTQVRQPSKIWSINQRQRNSQGQRSMSTDAAPSPAENANGCKLQ